MAIVYTNEQNYEDIADAIRAKNGTENTYKPSQMADAIRSLAGGVETDPVFSASPAAGITSTDIANWNTPEVFFVTISSDNTSSTGYRSNKTYAEVVAALNAGKLVIGTSNNTYFSALSKTGSAIQFVYNRSNAIRVYVLPSSSTEVTYSSTNIQSKLTFDDNPTASSTNPVKSGGVYTALENKQDSLPTISSGDAGKVLAVNSAETGYEYITAGNGDGSSSGVTYSAGTGISISNDTISIDNSVVALQSDIPTATSKLTNDSNFINGLVMLSYGSSTWNDFIEAYRANKVVYCMVDKRLAFMAYVNNVNNPSNVEFQYYRSVDSKSLTQQGDQVFVYKLQNNNSWSTITRENAVRINVGSNMTRTYSNGVITLDANAPTITNTLSSGTLIATINGTNIYAPSYEDGDDLLYGG